jgi:hypothetical protein
MTEEQGYFVLVFVFGYQGYFVDYFQFASLMGF